VEIYGPEASGKTTLALHVIAESQKRGGICLVSFKCWCYLEVIVMERETYFPISRPNFTSVLQICSVYLNYFVSNPSSVS
jgi:recA bacterial DNA recombination protein